MINTEINITGKHQIFGFKITLLTVPFNWAQKYTPDVLLFMVVPVRSMAIPEHSVSASWDTHK